MAQVEIAKLPPLVRIFVFLGGLVVLWLPLALPLYWLSGKSILPGGDLAPTALLYVMFLLLVPRWGRYIHGIQKPWAWLGVTGGSKLLQAFAVGLVWGATGILLLVGIQVVLGWAALRPLDELGPSLVGIFLGGLVTAIAVGCAEELLFRGWLLRELERGWSPPLALVGSSSIFALAHFIKPPSVMVQMLPQLVGLLLLGLVLGWARRIPIQCPDKNMRTALGYTVGIHTGLVWGYYLVNVGELIQPTGTVAAWVTGLDGNPLAGMLGLILLAGLAMITFYCSHRTVSKNINGEIRP
jgi:membrane protease YdiL (CAAX protease family)